MYLWLVSVFFKYKVKSFVVSFLFTEGKQEVFMRVSIASLSYQGIILECLKLFIAANLGPSSPFELHIDTEPMT